jgi:hypothetical protein
MVRMVRGCFEATKALRQSDRRDPILGGNVEDGAPTETGEVGHSLSYDGDGSTKFAEDQRSRRETEGDVGVSNRYDARRFGAMSLESEVDWVPGGDTRSSLTAELVEGRVPFGARITVHQLPWSPVDNFHSPIGCAALVFEGRARWVSSASGCLHPGVLRCSAGRQVAVLRARTETSRGFSPSRWQHRRGFREIRSFLQEFLW